MKKFYFLVLMVVYSLTGFGQQLFFEPFNYTPHATNGLAAQSNSTWLSVNTGDSILVTAGNLSYTGLPVSTGNKVKFDGGGTDYYTQFTSQTTGSVYGSFILNVTSLGGLSTTGGYFTGFIQSASTSSFGATVWTRLSTTAGKYNVGISTRSNSTVSWLATDLDLNTSYFIVMAYDVVTGTANDVARIWLNPVTGGTEPAANATSVFGTDLTSVARLFLRQDNGTNTPFIEVDEYRVGTTWASVTPGGAPSASLSSSSLTGFGNVCLNTTAGPNSFTITGTNLTTASVVVSSLAGYSFSTSAAGPYTGSLTLTQPGGSFSQQVFVNFTPTAVQSYNADIVVGGGGASSINVAATGAGVNSTPTLTTGSASGITTNTATVAGTINDAGCTVLTAYGIEYSLTTGFANGSGTQVPSTNLSGGSYTSSLIGLAPATTYYYKAYATNTAGTSWGTEQSFTTSNFAPTLSATTLTGFGNVCVNTTSAANSFTINGTNLTTANISVGPLAGYSFSTTAGGSYTSSLTLTQPGGTYSQQVFVKFNPTAVQSYNGDINLNGGGAPVTTNVAVTGSGVNSAPTVTTGVATGVTTTAATLAGTINNIGCSAITGYGIYYSTTNGFPNGSGTQVASTNLSSNNFTAGLSGLAPATTYYYKVYAINGGGTTYGTQQSFTTAAPPPSVLTATVLATFGNVCVNAVSATNSFTVTGTNLTSANVTVGPLAGYSFATSATGTFTSSLSLTQPGGSFSQVVYVKLSPSAVQSYNGNIPLGGGGSATTVNVAATGAGVSTPPSVTTMAPANVTTNSVAFPATITNSGCTPVTEFGIEYSGVNNFNNGSGNKVYGSIISSGMYALTVDGLVQGATYYYKAFVTNSGGITYGTQQSVTLMSIAGSFTVYPVPVRLGAELHFSVNSLTQGFYGIQLYNSAGQKVLEKGFNVQGDFINDKFTLPAILPVGIYNLRFINSTEVLYKKTILVIR